jgi:hypothetical protein
LCPDNAKNQLYETVKVDEISKNAPIYISVHLFVDKLGVGWNWPENNFLTWQKWMCTDGARWQISCLRAAHSYLIHLG